MSSRFPRSPFGSRISVGMPCSSASSISATPSPVLPEPVMPTITPWVVRSAALTSTASPVRAWSASTASPRKSWPGGTSITRRIVGAAQRGGGRWLRPRNGRTSRARSGARSRRRRTSRSDRSVAGRGRHPRSSWPGAPRRTSRRGLRSASGRLGFDPMPRASWASQPTRKPKPRMARMSTVGVSDSVGAGSARNASRPPRAPRSPRHRWTTSKLVFAGDTAEVWEQAKSNIRDV